MLCKFTANCTIGGGGAKRRICAICTRMLLAALIITFAVTAVCSVSAGALRGGDLIFNDNNGITYTLTPNGENTYKMTVSGSGGMEDFESQFNPSDYTTTITSPYYSHRENITEVVIESGITHIGKYAFWSFRSLTSVSIPTTVKTIGSSSFPSCYSLASVTIPEGTEEIGDNAFASCRALTAVNLPSTLRVIDGLAFTGCTALETVVIPEGVQTISAETFRGCTSLASVTLPSTLTSIESRAFSGCALTDITIPEGVGSIGVNAFARCNALDRIIYKDGVTLGENAVPDTATQVKYTTDGSAVTITEIILGNGKTAVEIPQTVNGTTVAAITDQELMKKVAHTHTGGTATCTQKAACTLCGLEYGELLPHTGGTASCTAKAVCDVCGNEYGDLAAHNFVNGVCTVCNAADPNYTTPTETTVTEDTTETEPTETTPEETASSETTPAETEPTGTAPTSPTGTSPSVPSRPSYPAPAVTTAVTTVTTVTTVAATTAEEEIIQGDYTGEDVGVDAAVYSEDEEIGGRVFCAALIYITIFAGLAIAVKKLRP